MYLTARGVELKLSGAYSNWTVTGAAGGVRTGTTRNDIFNSQKGDTLVGGAGDDTYHLWDAASKIVEKAGEGVDTVNVQYWGGYKLADNVENAFLISKGATWATGNALDNIIVAGSVGATLDGAAGNDVLVGGGGADVFAVTAGNGSEAIMNFRPGWDAIKLSGYGIATYDQVKAGATQTGSDVTIKLSAAESLVIRNVQLSALGAADFNLPMNTPVPAGANKVMSNPNQAWNANGWFVLNNAWGAGNLVAGKDYTMSSALNTADMTKGTTFNWSFPVYTSDLRVLAYPEVIFGWSPHNAAGNPTDTAKVFPVKVSDLAGLTATYDVSFGGNVGGFNVAYDIWLSNSATGTGTQAISNEIMIWVHQGSFGAPGDVVGTYSKDGITFKIYHTGTYTALIADKDVPAGTIDIAGILLALQKLGIVSPTEYVRSVELGAEVMSGTGSLTINDLDLRVETQTPGGGTVVMEVGGSGTTVTSGVTVSMAAFTESYKAGTEKILDENGSVVGSKTTVIPVKEKAVTTKYDLAGKVTGTDVVTVDKTSIVVQHYTSTNILLTAEKTTFNSDGTTQVIHYDAKWNITGSEKIYTDAQDRTVTQYYDAAWQPSGMDMVTTEANGAKLINHYDAAWKLTGAERVTVSGATVTTTHYDSKWAVIGAETFTTKADGSKSIAHLDSALKLVSTDVIKVTADGLRTWHYDAKNVLLGSEIDTITVTGVERKLMYDGGNKLTGIDWHGTDRADMIAGIANGNIIHGGLGSDTLYGGAGIDHFYLDTTIGQGDVDLIGQFQVSKDKIRLDHDIFTKLSVGALDPSQFVLGTVAKDANDHILFDGGKGHLYYDPDGNGALAPILLAQVKADAALNAGNFVVV